MIKLRQAIVVEGRYDKNKLMQIFDTLIIETSGFGIFKDKEKLKLLRDLAESRGIVVLTDGDGAGFVIRNYIKSSVQKGEVYHAYIPDMPGKEKRKRRPGKEGKIGVEGLPDDVIINAVMQSGAMEEEITRRSDEEDITEAVFFEMGLSGGAGSRALRCALVKKLGLPEHISAVSLRQVVSATMTKKQLEQAVLEIKTQK